MFDPQVYLDALDASIADIERWLSGTDTSPAALDALLAAFSADFTMIMTDGRVLDRDGMRVLFATLGGAKPGLRIALSDIRVRVADASHAVLTYLEAQHAASGELPARRATAVFARDAAGSVRWSHLQETFCTA
ncbi:polyketide cyclase [Burkholderia territorii]|uniref:nuclear transport factor 2 family protein n=1 Tax=Burkholderia territorii TaxID=1503055 RepID=UPI000757421F|nr:nuclear transport factor 2 family protein [Burkholderia territorii]KVK96080.1 polyketide cyclase [Burkholderia territorii]KWA26608.1 polyketide cyclase [Burkholderia territorii]KWA50319.1 polyketide cyclase [Burkholderia territorii]